MTNTQDFIRREGDGWHLSGDWTLETAGRIGKQLGKDAKAAARAAPRPDAAAPVVIDMTAIAEIDTAGAWLIRSHFGAPQAGWRMTQDQKKLMDFLPAQEDSRPAKPAANPLAAFVRGAGERALDAAGFLYGIMSFTGQSALRLFANILQPRRFRFPAITRHIQETGIAALPIIGLLGFLMSTVVSYQGALQLQKFGADIFTIDLTVISMLREMAVLVTAIMVAGRSGSAFAAEIGVMKLRRETDALEAMGLDPIELLVVPRIIALMIALPLLTFFADVIGLAGGAFMSNVLLDITYGQYIDRVASVATPTMFFVGMIKAPVFAFIIAIICTYQGMSASGSAESVGRLTTLAVVQSIFMVILADAAFSIVFAKVGI